MASTKPQDSVPGRIPALSDFVLVPEVPDHNNNSKVACAVVVGVHNDTINVRVWADNSDTPEWRTSLHQVESVEQFVDDETTKLPAMNLWCWLSK